MKRFLKCILFTILGVVALACVAIIGVNVFTEPLSERNWTDDQKLLAHADISDSYVTIHNIRNIKYASTTEYAVDYYDKTFYFKDMKRVWYMVEPFNSLPGAAHTLLSFEFEGDQFISISAEIRKEKGESFHPVKGLFNQYELVYVVADEKDVIKLRSNYRKDGVYLYPMKATPERARELFVDMLTRANSLATNPEFYNTVGSNCTTNIASHVNKLVPGRVPFDLSLLMPADSDRFAYDLGLIDTDLPFDLAREKYHINERAEEYANDPDFSKRIRE